jgi:hypothetical protein
MEMEMEMGAGRGPGGAGAAQKRAAIPARTVRGGPAA